VPARPTSPSQGSRHRAPRIERPRYRRKVSHGRSLVLKSALITIFVAIVAAILGVALLPGASQAERVPMPAASAGHDRAVGAIFTTSAGRLGSHFCSGSVVDSPSGDLVLTAAHCVSHGGKLAFVPDYSNGHDPYGVWLVSRVIVDQRWQSGSDADDDFAFLVVDQPGATASLQDLTGGEALGVGAPAGQMVTVSGYPGDLGTQISCRNVAMAFTQTQLQFDCGGFADGTSGSPLLANASAGGAGTVIGVIGGYEQGGLTPSVSYAARFGPSMTALYRTAIARAGR
jgi:V8-like Glu-specific endopeptidase